jgi:ribosomal protein S18 acetylase RimI-like enzyme
MTGMGWQTTGDAAEFLAMAGPYLRRERARNTVILTVTEAMRVNAAESAGASPPGDDATRPLLGWWSEPAGAAGRVGGAFLHTPQFPVVLTAVAPAVAAELASVTLAGRPVPGVNAHPPVAEAFAQAWRQAHGGQARVHVNQRLYRLGELSWPDPAPDGAARIAAEPDLPLLAGWFRAFAFEVHDMAQGRDQTADVRDRVSFGGVTVWQARGRPVAIASVTRLVAGMARVGPVYTPPEFRGRGYGSAVTAAASQRLLDAGADDVLLYTDLANPVSNSIYQRLGYRAVEDRIVLEFTAD